MARIVLSPLALFDEIIHPNFADIAPEFSGAYNSILSEFTLMDDVGLAHGRKLMDLFFLTNFLKRKDASCNTDWSKIGTTGNRRITVTELYGATQICQEQFYQGALKDFRIYAERHRAQLLSAHRKGISLNIATNAFFGDITRPDDTNGVWNWNKFDGIFTKYAQYIASGLLPNAQVMSALPDGDIAPADAYDILKEAFDKQSDLMVILPDLDKAFYVDYKLAKAYERYLQSLGNTTDGVQMLMNGIPILRFEGIPIYVEPLWTPVLRALNGGADAHVCILTIRGSWAFATNKTYGGGANLDQALRVWWSEDDEEWKQKIDLVAGTDIALVEHTVFGMTQL